MGLELKVIVGDQQTQIANYLREELLSFFLIGVIAHLHSK